MVQVFTARALGINDNGQVICGRVATRRAQILSGRQRPAPTSVPGRRNVYATGSNRGPCSSAGALVAVLTSGFIWQDGAMVNLNTLIDPSLGWTITDAYDINDRNQIAVYGCNLGGDCQALLLTAVPEPETYALLFGGLGLVSWAARRRQRAA